jgi:hypothetical protein
MANSIVKRYVFFCLRCAQPNAPMSRTYIPNTGPCQYVSLWIFSDFLEAILCD